MTMALTTIPTRNDTSPQPQEVTLLFTDVVGSTALTLQLGDAAAHQLMERHNEIVREELHHWGGREIEMQGDGFLLAFETASDGVGCAIAIQRAMDLYRATHSEDLRVRIGVHTGNAIPVDDRYFGSAVILCARIANAAGADEVLVSASTAGLARVDTRRLATPRFEALKGFESPQCVHPVRWQPLHTARRPRPQLAAAAMAAL